jgi:hypothetical protein
MLGVEGEISLPLGLDVVPWRWDGTGAGNGCPSQREREMMETGRKWRDIQTVGRRVVVAGRRFTLPEQRKLETIRPSVFLAWRNDLFSLSLFFLATILAASLLKLHSV